MDIAHVILDATRDKEIKELQSTNEKLRAIIEKTKEALKYFPEKDNGSGAPTGCDREQTKTHPRAGEDTDRDQTV